VWVCWMYGTTMGVQLVGGDPHGGIWRVRQVSPYQAGGFAAVGVQIVCVHYVSCFWWMPGWGISRPDSKEGSASQLCALQLQQCCRVCWVEGCCHRSPSGPAIDAAIY
jgi:hypothetical protein